MSIYINRISFREWDVYVGGNVLRLDKTIAHFSNNGNIKCLYQIPSDIVHVILLICEVRLYMYYWKKITHYNMQIKQSFGNII